MTAVAPAAVRARAFDAWAADYDRRTAPAEIQERYLPAFAAMLAGHGIGESDRLEVPYVVECWIARRKGA